MFPVSLCSQPGIGWAPGSAHRGGAWFLLSQLGRATLAHRGCQLGRVGDSPGATPEGQVRNVGQAPLVAGSCCTCPPPLSSPVDSRAHKGSQVIADTWQSPRALDPDSWGPLLAPACAHA